MLSHKGTRVLETERLILRPFSVNDAEQMYHNWASDPLVVKYLSWNVHPNIELTRELLEIWQEQYQRKDVYNWVIFHSAFECAIGGISVVGFDTDEETCEIGYCISSVHWNKGIASEALKAIVDFLFLEVGFNRIYAKYDIDNAASGRVMQKCGMKFEGVQREVKRLKDDTIHDLSVYSITMQDYMGYLKSVEDQPIRIDRPCLEDQSRINVFFKLVIEDTFMKNGVSHLKEDMEEELNIKKKYLKLDFISDGLERYFLIAKKGSRIIGSIEFGPANELIKSCGDEELNRLPEIGTLFVSPEFHHQGIGTRLLLTLAETLKSRGISEYCLDSGYQTAQKIWLHKFGAPKVVLKDQWGHGFDHMVWQVKIND